MPPTDEPRHVPASVIIPAHNESATIARCLHALSEGADPGELEIFVVCNGCVDDTAKVARAALPAVKVIELERASKAAALNVGDAAATRFPRIYVDADVELDIPALRATVRALTDSPVLCAAPRPRFELTGRSFLIRSYYEVWQLLPYLNDEVVGTGVYALSAEGRARFDEFPDITADDQFVLQQFERTERLALRDQAFLVHPPTSCRGLFAIRRRAYRGARELEASGLAAHESGPSGMRTLVSLMRSPRDWLPVAIYAVVSVSAKVAARLTRSGGWERDDSARRI